MSIPFLRSTEIGAIELVYKTRFAADARRRRQDASKSNLWSAPSEVRRSGSSRACRVHGPQVQLATLPFRDILAQYKGAATANEDGGRRDKLQDARTDLSVVRWSVCGLFLRHSSSFRTL